MRVHIRNGYEVDEDGNVYSKYRKLKPVKTAAGYLQVSLGRGDTSQVQRLVADKFVPNPHNLTVVNHKDNDKSNNRASNLEWCTQKDNVLHAVRQDRHAKGEDQGLSKLKAEDVEFIRTNHKPYDREFGTKPLARKFGVDPAAVLSVVRNKTWKHIQ